MRSVRAVADRASPRFAATRVAARKALIRYPGAPAQGRPPASRTTPAGPFSGPGAVAAPQGDRQARGGLSALGRPAPDRCIQGLYANPPDMPEILV